MAASAEENEKCKNAEGKLKTDNAKEKSFILKKVTIELLVVIYLITVKLAEPAIKTMELEKSCKVTNHFNNTVCKLILNSAFQDIKHQNFQVQESISKMNIWLAPITTIMPTLMILFLGSYSDKHHVRKPFLLIPLAGEFLSNIGCLICAVFMNDISLEMLGVIRHVIPSLFGGHTVFLMATYSYIVDVSSVETRTVRVGVVRLLIHFTNIITKATSGIVFQQIGYYGILATALLSSLVGLIYGVCCVSEPRKLKEGKCEERAIKDVFNPNHAFETFLLLVKEKKGNRLRSVQIIIFSLLIYHGVIHGK